MLDRDPMRVVFGGEQAVAKFLKHLRQTFVEIELLAQRFELVVRRTIHPERVEQHFHVSELVVVTVFAHQGAATVPELPPVDPKFRKDNFVLHVARTERLIVIVNDRDGILRRGHGVEVEALQSLSANESSLQRFIPSSL